jgi:hypothetical protein
MPAGRNEFPTITTRPCAESAKLVVVGTMQSPRGPVGPESELLQAAAIPKAINDATRTAEPLALIIASMSQVRAEAMAGAGGAHRDAGGGTS